MSLESANSSEINPLTEGVGWGGVGWGGVGWGGVGWGGVGVGWGGVGWYPCEDGVQGH